MARIRTIKPEFWDSPGTARASLRARLFFIAMWNYADDWGIGDGHPLRLLSFAFPNDETSDVEPRNFRLLASEVAECFDVQWYEVEGRAFYAIPSWEEHQRTEKKAKRRNPPPDQAFARLYEKESENPPLDRGLASEGKGKGERGNGKGEVKNSSSPSVTVSESDFERAWAHWPKKVERKKSLEMFKVKAKTHPRGLEALISDITMFGTAYANTTEKQFVPALAVWLRGERWTDELPTASADVVDAQWNALMGEHRPDPCAGGHKWAVDGECIRCQTRRTDEDHD